MPELCESFSYDVLLANWGKQPIFFNPCHGLNSPISILPGSSCGELHKYSGLLPQAGEGLHVGTLLMCRELSSEKLEKPAWDSSACSGGGGPNLAQVRFGCRVSALGVIFVFRGLQAGTFIDMSKENKEASTNGFIIRPRGAPIMKLPPTQIAPLLSRANNGVKDNQPSPVPAYTPFSMSSCTSH